jgi:methionine synthase I (cobalamin-dependent)
MCRYAVTRFYLGKVGEAHRVRELAQLSVSLAHTAASVASRGTLIAASVPPLGESYALRTASELSEMRDEWREIVGGLLAPPGAHATRSHTIT